MSTKKYLIFVLTAFVLLLNACGGGGGGTPDVANRGTLSLLAGSTAWPGIVDGEPSVARFEAANSLFITADPRGGIFVLDNGIPRTVTADGAVMTMAGKYSDGGIAIAAAGDGAYWIATSTDIHRLSAAGEAVVPFSYGNKITADSQGNAYVEDGHCVVWKVTPQLAFSQFAGIPDSCGSVDGPAGQARLPPVNAIGIDRQGNLLIVDTWQAPRLRPIASDGSISTITLQAELPQPSYFSKQVTVDGAGTIYMLDLSNHPVRIDTAGRMTTLTDVDTTSIAADVQGNLYVSQFQSIGIYAPAVIPFRC